MNTRITTFVLVALLSFFTAAAHAQDTVGMGSVRGTVTNADGTPANDVAICVGGTGACAVSGADGRFTVASVKPGSYQIEILAPGRAALLSPVVEVRAGLDVAVDITLPADTAIEETVTVSAPAVTLPTEIKNSAFLISSRDILAGAGALQDVSRYVQALPGVAIGSDDFRNDLIVRGGSPLENLFIVDNVEIPNINTFATFASAGGTVSMVDAQLIEDVTFLTGGYPAPYGNRTSSVMQITQREGDRSRLGGRATLGFAGAGMVLEGPLGGSGAGSWIVSARRSFLDLVTDDVGIGGVPVLYTLNAKATYDVSPRDRVWFVNISGIDRVRLGLTAESEFDSELSNLDIRYAGRRSATGVNWQRAIGGNAIGLLGLSYSRATVDQRVKDLLRNGLPAPATPVDDQIAAAALVFREDSIESETAMKYDFTAQLGAGSIHAGAGIRRIVANYDAESPFGIDSPFFAEPDTNAFAVKETSASYLIGAYLQGTRALTARLSTTIGARFDRFEFLNANTISPRLGLDYALTPRLSLRASYGQYTQQPFTLFLTAFPENRTLRPFRADHYVAGVSYRPGETTRVTAEFYRKRYRDYPTSSQIPSLSLANVGDTFSLRDILFPLVSAGRGEAEGAEIFAERLAAPGRRWHAQANAAFSRVRYSGLDGIARPGSFEYPIVANLSGTLRLSSRWDLSTRVAYLAGRPYTPFDLAASSAQRRGVYNLSQVNAARLPDYFRLDLRADRRFTVNGREVTVFGGVQNLTNRRNVANFSWDRRNNMMRINDQLGLFPMLGLDWRF